MANVYLEHLLEYRLVVCKTCRHAVWPDQIRSHYQVRNHRLSHKEAAAITDEVRELVHVTRYASQFEVP